MSIEVKFFLGEENLGPTFGLTDERGEQMVEAANLAIEELTKTNENPMVPEVLDAVIKATKPVDIQELAYIITAVLQAPSRSSNPGMELLQQLLAGPRD